MGIINYLRKHMSVSQDVIWQLTKRNNSSLVKFNFNQWSKNKMNMTGFHNASQAASSLSVKASGKGKSLRFNIYGKCAQKHGIKKVVKASCNNGTNYCHSTSTAGHAAKAVKNMVFPAAHHKKMALQRVQRIHVQDRSSVPKAKAAKAE